MEYSSSGTFLSSLNEYVDDKERKTVFHNKVGSKQDLHIALEPPLFTRTQKKNFVKKPEIQAKINDLFSNMKTIETPVSIKEQVK